MKSKDTDKDVVSSFSFMVVDDSEFACRNIEKMMVAIGGTLVGFANNGREAVERYPKLHPDLVLMDITMPEMEGIEAVQGILAQDSAAKVVMVSSMGFQDMIKKALASGAKHFLTKPVKPEQAASVVKFVLKES